MSTHPTFAHGKLCYVELPSQDIKESAEFYKNVFGWNIRIRGDGAVAFDDGVNEVSGCFRSDRQPLDQLGILIYIMVLDIEPVIESIIKNGGKIVKPVGLDHPEITARFTDPSGNLLGIFQQ